MNCTVCLEAIEKSKGYYLVMGVPYCKNCYQAQPDDIKTVGKTHSPAHRWNSEHLLAEFRAYQKRDLAMVCRN